MFPIYTQFHLCPKGTVFQDSWPLFQSSACFSKTSVGLQKIWGRNKVTRSMGFHLIQYRTFGERNLKFFHHFLFLPIASMACLPSSIHLPSPISFIYIIFLFQSFTLQKSKFATIFHCCASSYNCQACAQILRFASANYSTSHK